MLRVIEQSKIISSQISKKKPTRIGIKELNTTQNVTEIDKTIDIKRLQNNIAN